MSNYVPTTEEVRDGWVCLIFDGGAREEAKLDSRWNQELSEAQFDRWLAEVERAAAEKAWAEGWATRASRSYGHLKVGESVPAPRHINPYRKEVSDASP